MHSLPQNDEEWNRIVQLEIAFLFLPGCKNRNAISNCPLFIVGRCFGKVLPLETVVTEDGQLNVLARGDVEELAGAGEQLIFVLVDGPGFTVESEEALHDHGVDGKQDRAGLWQAQQA